MDSMWKVDLYLTPVYVQKYHYRGNVNIKLYHNEPRSLEGFEAIS